MRIGIDIDDTICETNKILIKKALAFDKQFVLGKGFKDKDAYRFVDMLYWDMNDVTRFFSYYLKNQNIYNNLKEIKDASFYINKLYNEGHKIIFITKRNSEILTKKVTKDWLKRHNIPYHKIIMDAHDKGQICLDEKVDLLIDDAEMNINDALLNHIDALLMTTKYNQKTDYKKRVHYWKEVYDYVNGVKKWEE